MRSLNLEFWSQQIRAFEQKVILQYNVYVILCFLHLLLKYDCVGVYSRFKNLFKNFFISQVCELPVIVRFVKNHFLVVLGIKKIQDDSGECCGFYHHSNVLKHKNEKEGVGFIILTPSLRLLR